MRRLILTFAAVALVPLCFPGQAPGQAVNTPVIFPRGVTDHLRHDPAPATVARGAVVEINGFNLGPDAPLVFKAAPLPSSLGIPLSRC